MAGPDHGFVWQTEQFADLRILRYRVPGFEALDVRTRKLIYYLSQAALAGRDIIWDQHHPENLRIRRTLDGIVSSWDGSREDEGWGAFIEYTKRVWFSAGIHHHYSTKKILPGFSPGYFAELVRETPAGALPLDEGWTHDDLVEHLRPLIFDPDVDPVRVSQDPEGDLVADSANNYYRGLTREEVEAYYAERVDPDDPRPISWGLNSRLDKGPDGEIRERTWKLGGLYTEAIEQIVHWLGKAVEVAEGEAQREALRGLIRFWETGDLSDFDEYSIAWLRDTDSVVDVVNGFIEVYGDPMGMRGAFESMVSVRDDEGTERIQAISDEAAWFEANTPVLDAHRKDEVQGISAKAIHVAMASGDASPALPIGVNLPNAEWIRREHGSKSVNLTNIVQARHEAGRQVGVVREFAATEEEVAREARWATLPADLHTDLHEVIGHASGRLEEGIASPAETLRNYASTLEEARADLVALWFLMDDKLVDLGVMPELDVGKAAYDAYVRNGLLVQLSRIEPGDDLQQAHMRNRQMVASWAYERGREDGIIERVDRDGKTGFAIRDYEALRALWGELLREVQRIKSQGDYEAGRELVETWGVRVDRALHEEVLERWAKLGLAPYAGFLNPRLVATEREGEVCDVHIEYPEDFTEQMLEYARHYSFLPTVND
ncbi:MAG: dipeptidyl-peptidase 3 family protein [Myxococcota bacterium]